MDRLKGAVTDRHSHGREVRCGEHVGRDGHQEIPVVQARPRGGDLGGAPPRRRRRRVVRVGRVGRHPVLHYKNDGNVGALTVGSAATATVPVAGAPAGGPRQAQAHQGGVG